MEVKALEMDDTVRSERKYSSERKIVLGKEFKVGIVLCSKVFEENGNF